MEIDESPVAAQAADPADLYRAILNAVRAMHRSAQAEQWPDVAASAREYERATQALHSSPAQVRAETMDESQRRAILTEILAHDAAVRDLVFPAQARLGRLITDHLERTRALGSYRLHSTATGIAHGERRR